MANLKRYSPFPVILLYIILSVIKLDYPGFQYDELLFGNAALGDFDRTFVYKKISVLPIMLMPYIGALKAYFYYPIFLLFNPSYASVRLPMVLLAAVSLWLIYKYVLKGAGFPTAILSLLLLVADSSFISLTRTDVGPVVIGLFFRCLALSYFFKFIEVRRGKYLIVIGGSLLLGFYDKLNFVWFIIAFLIAAAVFYGNVFGNLSKLFKAKSAKIIIGIFLVIFAILIGFVFRLGVISELSLLPTQGHLSVFCNLWFGSMNGSVFYEYLIGDWNGSFAFGWIIWLIISSGSAAAFLHPKSDLKTFHLFNLMILVLTLVQILLTDKATAPWHFFMLQPMTAILTASSLVFLSQAIFAKSKAQRRMLLIASATAIFGVQLFSYAGYVADYEKPYRNFMWSKKIDDLYAYTQSVPNRFVALDWGFHTQLLTLGRQGGKYYELAFVLNETVTPAKMQQIKTDLLNPDNECFFLMHNENDTLFKTARRRFFEVAEESGWQAELIKTFDEAERPLYEVYRLKRK